jgi:hypothetical protein
MVIRLHTDPENRGTGAYQLLTPYTHGVPYVDCEGPSAVNQTSVQGRKRGQCHRNAWQPHQSKTAAALQQLQHLRLHYCSCCYCSSSVAPAATPSAAAAAAAPASGCVLLSWRGSRAGANFSPASTA